MFVFFVIVSSDGGVDSALDGSQDFIFIKAHDIVKHGCEFATSLVCLVLF